MDKLAVLSWLNSDAESIRAIKERDREGLLGRLHLKWDFTASANQDALYMTVKSWIAQADCPFNVAQAYEESRRTKKRKRTRQRHFIHNAGLNVSDSDRKEKLESIPVRIVKPLERPYPPYKETIAESQEISGKWYDHFTTGYQADSRIPRLPIHQLDPSSLVLDILPNESVRLETPSGDLVGLVIRNFCPSDEAIEWADNEAEKQVPCRRNIRKEDTGKLVQLGWSAGQRSKRAFHWVKNLTQSRITQDQAAELNKDAANLFAFAWQRLRNVLPDVVLDDYDQFVQSNRLPRMNPDDPLSTLPKEKKDKDESKGTVSNEHPRGTYTVRIQGEDAFQFHDVELAPPSGFIGKNYTRATHRENHPHTYGVQWTLSRTPNVGAGGNFYFSRYGVRVRQAPNTLIVWRPTDAHGSSLPDMDPQDENPRFCQRNLAFVTSDRIAKAWEEYQKNRKSAEEAAEMAEADSDDDDAHGVLYE